MKRFILGISLFFITSSSCYSNEVVVDLDKCRIGQNNFSFERLNKEIFSNGMDSIKFNYIKKVSKQITYATGVETKLWNNHRGASWEDENGNTLMSLNRASSPSRGGSYLILNFKTNFLKTIPNIHAQSSTNDIEAIFGNNIINKQSMNEGDFINYKVLLCSKYEAEINVPTKQGLQNDSSLKSWMYPITIELLLIPSSDVNDDKKQNYKNNNYSLSSNNDTPKRKKFTCKFHCVGQFDIWRGGEQTVQGYGTYFGDAQDWIKKNYESQCAKNFPFYEGGGGSASVGKVSCTDY
jgi:hypothetical protein